MAIHQTAVIDPKAELDSSVEVGPYAVIEGPVKVGADTILRAHTYLCGWTQVGRACDIHPFAVVGNLPQDFNYHGERSYCRVGNGVILREGSTIHRGSQPESETIVGDDCLLMAYAHVGHNCILGKGAKVYNFAALAGHVDVGDNAIISASSLVHQFVRIGGLAFVAAGTRITMDVPPFLMAFGESTIVQHNVIGMRRAGFTPQAIHEIRNAYRTLYRSGLLFSRAVERLQESMKTAAGRQLAEFLAAESQRGVCRGGGHHRDRTKPDAEAASAHIPPAEAKESVR